MREGENGDKGQGRDLGKEGKKREERRIERMKVGEDQGQYEREKRSERHRKEDGEGWSELRKDKKGNARERESRSGREGTRHTW